MQDLTNHRSLEVEYLNKELMLDVKGELISNQQYKITWPILPQKLFQKKKKNMLCKSTFNQLMYASPSKHLCKIKFKYI